MEVKLNTNFARAGLTASAGAIIDVEKAEADALVEGGFAEFVTTDARGRKVADREKSQSKRAAGRETATA